jgi:hypothetical protein
VVCGVVVCSFSLAGASPGAQTGPSTPDLTRLVARIMRDGISDTMAPDVAANVGLERKALPYKGIIAPDVRRVHRDVAVILVDGCEETRVDLCREIIFGHVGRGDYWALRATPSARWTAGFVYRANNAAVNRAMTKEDGEQKLATEKAFWLAWLAQ